MMVRILPEDGAEELWEWPVSLPDVDGSSRL